jgi:hypothetical protein
MRGGHETGQNQLRYSDGHFVLFCTFVSRASTEFSAMEIPSEKPSNRAVKGWMLAYSMRSKAKWLYLSHFLFDAAHL